MNSTTSLRSVAVAAALGCFVLSGLLVSVLAQVPQAKPPEPETSEPWPTYTPEEQRRIWMREHADELNSDSPGRTREAERLRKIRQDALAYGKGSDKYYAVLHQGLKALAAQPPVRRPSAFALPSAKAPGFFAGRPDDNSAISVAPPAALSTPELATNQLDAARDGEIRKSLDGIFAMVEGGDAGSQPFATNSEPVCKEVRWREAVALFNTETGGLCSGAVISKGTTDGSEPGKILTAAHCVCALKLRTSVAKTKVAIGRRTPSGQKNACSPATPLPVVADITGARMRLPNFCTLAGNYVVPGQDLAIVYFRRPAGADFVSRDVATAAQYDRRISDNVVVVGFGATGDGAVQCPLFERSSGHKATIITSIRSPRCSGASKPAGTDCQSNAEAFLADAESSGLDVCDSDSCGGDSGGPALAMVETAPKGCEHGGPACDHRIFAVVSRSRGRTLNTCGPGGIYSLVTPDIVAAIESQPMVTPAP